jgi:hypothetical protein
VGVDVSTARTFISVFNSSMIFAPESQARLGAEGLVKYPGYSNCHKYVPLSRWRRGSCGFRRSLFLTIL